MTVRITAGLCALAATLAAPGAWAGPGGAGASGVEVAQAGQQVTPPAGGDYAEDTGTEGRLAPGGQVTSAIDLPGEADWFAIELEADTVYAFDMQGAPTGAGSLGDPLLTLHDGRGAEVARDDDGGAGFNARLVFVPPQPGRYYVAARAFADATGTYTLSAADRGPARDDYAAAPDTSGTLPVGGSARGEIELPNDADWFAVDLQPDLVYVFDMRGQPSGGGTLSDPLLRIHTADGTELAADDDGGEGFDARLTFVAPQAGRYYLAAQAFGSNTGSYTLQAAERGPVTDDFAADQGTAGRLAVGGTASGELELPGDVDWFAIELDAGVGYAIGMEGEATGRGSLPDPLLALHDASGAEVARDDDGGQNLNARISYVPRRTGTHYVAAQAFGNRTGTYTVTADTAAVPGTGKPGPGGGQGPAVSDDYADGPDTDGRLTLGQPVQGSIDAPGDADWFAVDLTADVAHLFDMRGPPDGTLQDPLLTLHDASGTEVARDDDGGDGLNPRLAFVPPRDGRYYVAARAFADHTGTYTLTGQARPDLRDDHPASAETAARVAIGRPGRGEIELPGDADWFAVELDPGNTYSFDLEGQPTAQGTLADPLLALHDPRGAEVARDDDGGTGFNARITHRAEQGGTYYLAAQAFGSATGTYTLTVDRYAGFEDDFADGPETEGRLAVGDSATGTLEVPEDQDWFAVRLERGRTYTIELEGQPTGAGSLPDPLLAVHDSGGRELARDDDGGTSFNARLTFSPPATDVYFVNAQAFGAANGSYRVTIREGGATGPAGK